MSDILTPARVRSALERRAFSALKEELALAPDALARLWPKLSALDRAACWRLLPPAALPAAVKAMSPAARWEAYQASSIDCVAPYLEDGALGARRSFRAPTRREASLLRASLAA